MELYEEMFQFSVDDCKEGNVEMKKQPLYEPLRFITQGPGVEDEAITGIEFLETIGVKEKISEEELVRFVLSPNFLDTEYRGKYTDINRVLIQNIEVLEMMMGVKKTDFAERKISPAAEWKDFFLMPIMMENWAKNKQVYKPDPDFAEALLRTEHLEFFRENIRALPCRSLYIDLTGCAGFGEIAGIFVTVLEYGNQLHIIEYLLGKDMVAYSFYGGGEYDENGILKIDPADFGEDMGYEVYCTRTTETRVYENTKDRMAITIFGMQMLNYLTVKKPDIQENPKTKSTYRPPRPGQPVKNKFSEVRVQDVGIRYGTAVRTMLKEEQQKIEKVGELEKPADAPNRKPRKSPVPHFRRAHWQVYWVGKGRKEREVKWLEPIFVGFGDTAKNVVIHMVK